MKLECYSCGFPERTENAKTRPNEISKDALMRLWVEKAFERESQGANVFVRGLILENTRCSVDARR